MTREHFQGPISHHLCRECIQSVCLSFCPSLPLLYNWGGFIIIVALICLLRTSPLLSFCCTCLSLMLSRCTLGAGVASSFLISGSLHFYFVCWSIYFYFSVTSSLYLQKCCQSLILSPCWRVWIVLWPKSYFTVECEYFLFQYVCFFYWKFNKPVVFYDILYFWSIIDTLVVIKIIDEYFRCLYFYIFWFLFKFQ